MDARSFYLVYKGVYMPWMCRSISLFLQLRRSHNISDPKPRCSLYDAGYICFHLFSIIFYTVKYSNVTSKQQANRKHALEY